MSVIKKPPPDWQGEEQKRWRENAADVPRQVGEGEKGMMRRVRTYCARFGYGIAKVVGKIRNDEMFAAHFAKDPTKQVMHEHIAADYLQKIAGIDGFVVLPGSGGNAFYINADGVFCRGVGKGAHDSKTLDFYWKSNGVECWASHKYTKESGGAQDHQFNDQKRFLENFRKHKGERVAFFAICDGDYYNEKKMAELQEVTNKTPPSFAVHIEDVEAKLRQLR